MECVRSRMASAVRLNCATCRSTRTMEISSNNAPPVKPLESPTELPQVFISYSRTDAGMAGRVHSALEATLGSGYVYMDTAGPAHAGKAWLPHIERVLAGAWLVICIVGKDWKKKVTNPKDHLRLELEYAVDQHLSFLPILLDCVKMPAATEVPESLRPIVALQAEFLRSETIRRDLPFIESAIKTLLHEGIPNKMSGDSSIGEALLLPSSMTAAAWTHEARKLLLREARSGQPEAQHELGLRFLLGAGTRVNMRLAIEFLELASKGGSTNAAINLLRLSDSGSEVASRALTCLLDMDARATERFVASHGGAIEILARLSKERVEALRPRALAGDREAREELMKRADAGDSTAARYISEVLGCEEATTR